MRKPYPFYSLLTLGGLFLAGSCSIIAEVDRTKIPTDGGTTPEGGQGSGATSGAGGSKAGSSGSGPTGGTSGEGGMGGEPGGGTSGTGGAGGEPGGSGGEPGGMGGDGGEPPIPACGDGTIDLGEDCDDNVTPPGGGDGCSVTCQQEAGWTCTETPSICVAALCGDRIVAGAEACDDGNNLACGTCTVGCSTSITAAAATGTITPGAGAPGDLLDDETFTLNDGTHPAVVFEFDEAASGDGVTTGRIAIAFDVAGTPDALQAAIIAAINGVADTTLAITAAPGTAVPNVALTNQVPGTAGNQTSGETVANATFMISAMAGGAARNCAVGVGCNVAADCLSGICDATDHLCD